MSVDSECTISARWLFPVASPPLDRGTITVREDRILSLNPHGERTPDLDLGNVALLPGLVNAHTHLDLSGLRNTTPPDPSFTDWLRLIVASRFQRSAEQVQIDIQTGLDEALKFGTTLIGDISAGGASWEKLVAAPMWAVVYRELIGLPMERASSSLADAIIWLVMNPSTDTCRAGLSPHAPYSARVTLFRRIADLVKEAPIPVVSHIGETLDELHLIGERGGPFVPFLMDLGVYDPEGLVETFEELLMMFNGNPTFGIAHGNYLEAAVSSERLQSFTRIYCPRTHAAFGHPPYPLSAKNQFVLGTDSLASNPDLDVFAEAQFVAGRYPFLSGAKLLEMCTKNGAELLGFGDLTGTLEPGKSADLVAIPLPDLAITDPHPLLFNPFVELGAERRTMFRGKWRTNVTSS